MGTGGVWDLTLTSPGGSHTLDLGTEVQNRTEGCFATWAARTEVLVNLRLRRGLGNLF